MNQLKEEENYKYHHSEPKITPCSTCARTKLAVSESHRSLVLCDNSSSLFGTNVVINHTLPSVFCLYV